MYSRIAALLRTPTPVTAGWRDCGWALCVEGTPIDIFSTEEIARKEADLCLKNNIGPVSIHRAQMLSALPRTEEDTP